MIRVLDWLSARPFLAVILGLVYFAITATAHDLVNNAFLKAKEAVGTTVYVYGIAGFCVLILVGLTMLLARRVPPGPRKAIALSYWFATLALIAVVYLVLVTLSSESIHLVQYAVLAVVAFSLTRRFTETILWVTLFGAVDEGYQYAVLHANWGVYFDFNDVVLNLIGGGIGLVFIYAFAARGLVRPSDPPFTLRRALTGPAVLTTLGLVVGGVVLKLAGLLALSPAPEGVASAPILLSRTAPPEHFWNVVEWGKRFHVLHPVSGVVLVLILSAFYGALDFLTWGRRWVQELRAPIPGSTPVAGAVLVLAGTLLAGSLVAPPRAAASDFRATAERPFTMPRGYLCHPVEGALTIDGRLDDPAWESAPWSEAFQDIQGIGHPVPRFLTRMKMLWDRENLYIAASMEEPHVWGTLTEHDAVIFHDNDFEVFLDPDGDHHQYFEFEINALNTGWDLLLGKPYRDGGPALNEWEIPGLQTAVHVDGTLNDPSDEDRGWSVEIAIPWEALRRFAGRPVPPVEGDRWRVNFSRVQWKHTVVDGVYAKIEGEKEDNWVWSAQDAIDMHRPERWGYVQFTSRGPGEAEFVSDPSARARHRLMQIYHAQRAYHEEHGSWATSLEALDLPEDEIPPDAIRLIVVGEGWIASTDLVLPDGSRRRLIVRQDSRLTEAAS